MIVDDILRLSPIRRAHYFSNHAQTQKITTGRRIAPPGVFISFSI